MTVTESEGRAECVAPLGDLAPDRVRPDVRFSSWWNTGVIKDNSGRTWTRREIVLEVANTAGGAHVDRALDDDFARLTRENALAWVMVSSTGDEWPLGDPVPPSLRQIGYELQETLGRYCSNELA